MLVETGSFTAETSETSSTILILGQKPKISLFCSGHGPEMPEVLAVSSLWSGHLLSFFSFYTVAQKPCECDQNSSVDIHPLEELQNWLSGSSWWKWAISIIILVVMLLIFEPCCLS